MGHERRRASTAHSIAVALRREDPALHLGNTVELAMMGNAQMSKLNECESQRMV